jgi:hypothetical protein
MFGKKEILESLRNMQIEMHALNKKIALINEMMDIDNVAKHDIISKLDVTDERMESVEKGFKELKDFIDSRNYDDVTIKNLLKQALHEYKEEMMSEKPKKVVKKK